MCLTLSYSSHHFVIDRFELLILICIVVLTPQTVLLICAPISDQLYRHSTFPQDEANEAILSDACECYLASANFNWIIHVVHVV